MVGTTLADGWGNVGGWLGQHWLMIGLTLHKVGTTLVDGWVNVGRWLEQHWLMDGVTLADGLDKVG